MKNIKKAIQKEKYRRPYKSADTKNPENYPAWKTPNKDKIRQLMYTGTLQNTFYLDQEKVVSNAVSIIERAAKSNPEHLARMIVAGRNEGFIRTAPILGLIILSMHRTDLFKKIFNDVVRTGNDMQDYLDLNRSFRGYGRAVKTSIHNWLNENLTPYYAIKYRNQIADAIRLSRPVSDDPIYGYVLDSKIDVSRRELRQAYRKYPQLDANESAKDAIAENDWRKASNLIEKHRLNPMSLLGMGNPPTRVWRSLAEQMGTMMYLKFLNKLIREDALDVAVMRNKLTVSNLKKAKVFPFRLYIAYYYLDREGNPEIVKDVSEHLSHLLNEYTLEYDWGKWDKKIVIAPDVSGSMGMSVRNEGSIIPSHVAGMFSGILYKGLKNSLLFPWARTVRAKKVKPRSDSVMTHIQSITNAVGGGTTMEAPLIKMLQHNVKSDVLIYITDSIEWGRRGWLGEWKSYRRQNPNAKAVLIRVDPYPTSPFEESTAEANGIYQVFGFNDSVFKWIEQVVL